MLQSFYVNTVITVAIWMIVDFRGDFLTNSATPSVPFSIWLSLKNAAAGLSPYAGAVY